MFICRWDFLYIYDGDSSSAPTIAKLHGSTLPSILSSKGAMFLRFKSVAPIVMAYIAMAYTVMALYGYGPI